MGERKFRKHWQKEYVGVRVRGMSNFRIVSSSIISSNFKERKISSFEEACLYIKQLPYKRNVDKSNSECVLNDGFGTCSTKHALLKRLADENSKSEIKLILGIFRMSRANTPSIKNVLDKYDLEYIPEAHNYLRTDERIIDCTKLGFGADNYIADLISEIEIETLQITDFKVQYHQDFLKTWLTNESNIKFTFEEIWSIREECIEAFS